VGKHCLISIIVCCLSCGIFSPRPVEYPSENPPVTKDPFHFASLLNGTGKTFNKLEYNDLFSDTMRYIDIDGRIFNKQKVIDNLHNVEAQFILKEVSWGRDTARTKDFLVGDTLFIYRSYVVIAVDSITVPQVTDTFDGSASFKIVNDPLKNTETIAEWKDTYPGISIFHPPGN
jgi:hypothetical protein